MKPTTCRALGGAAIILAAGCMPTVGLDAPRSLTRVSDGASSPPSSVVINEAIGGLTFQAPSGDDLKTIGPQDLHGGYYLPHKPYVGLPYSTAPRVESGNFRFYIEPQSPGDWGRDALMVGVFATAHQQPVTRGQEAGYVQQTILPLVRAWAADGKLDTAYGLLPDLGQQRAGTWKGFEPEKVKDEAAILQNAGWPLAYRSEAKREVLYFYASGLVVHMKWVSKDRDQTNVPVSKQEAIALHVSHMRDPAFKSDEERTGLDHFLGIPYQDVFPPPSMNVHDDLVPASIVPDESHWRAEFSYSFAGKPVWTILGDGSSGLGIGRVDAQSGVEFRFQRPVEGYHLGPFVPTPFTPTAQPSRQ